MKGCLDCTDDAEFPQGLRFQLSPLPLQGTWEGSKIFSQIQGFKHIPLKIEIVLKELRYNRYAMLWYGQLKRFCYSFKKIRGQSKNETETQSSNHRSMVLFRQVKSRGFSCKSCSLGEHLCSLGKASSGLNCTPVNTTSGIRIVKRKHWSSNVSSMFMVVYDLPFASFWFHGSSYALDQNLPRRIKTLRISPFQLHDRLPGRPKTRQRAVETLGKNELLHVLYSVICAMYE